MDETAVVVVEPELGTKHQVAVVVLSAIAGYAASKLVGAAYGTAYNKFQTMKANRAE